MKRFAELYTDLDRTTRTNEKIAALVRYFRDAPPDDAAWGLYFLSGRTLPRPVPTKVLREWIAEASGLPLWLVEESYHVVGDLAETFSLLLEPARDGAALTLGELVDRLAHIAALPEAERKGSLFSLWGHLDRRQSFLFMKLVTGGMRVGVQRTLLSRALAELSGLPQHQIAHRLMGGIKPTAEYLRALLSSGGEERDPGQPYPLCLAHPLEEPLDALGSPRSWQAEWKWDGIRAEILRRAGLALLWSRGEEVITDTFPEITEAVAAVPDGTVLDGEIVAWGDGVPLPFGELQRRLGRKTVGARLRAEVPVRYLAYDVLEEDGRDIRQQATEVRRRSLERLIRAAASPVLGISPLLEFQSWDELRRIRQGARSAQAEGCMLKALGQPYGVGRKRGLWWKWKIDPHRCDAVLVYAQRGHGRRAGLFTDYTFAVWKEGALVPVAKAYSGLTDAEILTVNRFIREHTLERFGPVVTVEPLLVFELAFDDIRRSSRHKAGLALRFPRIARFRTDKKPEEADSVDALLALMPSL